jgi:hypothetical protein
MVVVRIHVGVILCVGVSYSGSTYPWGGYNPSSILGTPTYEMTGSMGCFLYDLRFRVSRQFYNKEY